MVLRRNHLTFPSPYKQKQCSRGQIKLKQLSQKKLRTKTENRHLAAKMTLVQSCPFVLEAKHILRKRRVL